MSKQSEFVASYLEQNNMSRSALSKKIGMSASTVSNILTGRMAFSKNIALKLNDLFGMSVNFLLYGEGDPMGVDNTAPADSELYKVKVSGEFYTIIKVRATSLENAKRTAINRVKNGEYTEDSLIMVNDSLVAD